MAKITQAIFLHLAGKTPAHLQLPRLKTSRSTFAAIQDSFRRYLADGVQWTYCDDVADLPSSCETGLSVVYLMGHAWLRDGTFATAVLKDSSSVEIAGAEVISFLLPYLKGPAILFFDTCNAASIAPVLERREYQGVAAVFGSAADESALEFPIDSATRLALTLDQVIQSLPGDTDVSYLAIQAAKKIQSGAVMAPQTVSYLPARPPILLSKESAERGRSARSRTYIIVRTLLVSLGVGLAGAIAGVLWYWRFHVQVEIQSPPLSIVEGGLSVGVRKQNPDLNTNELIETDTLLPGTTLRLRLPAEDLLFVVQAKFRDGQPRAIRFHTVNRPTFSMASKFLHFDLPGTAEIKSHPNMAYVPATEWLSGPDRTTSHNREGYWIDLYPPTVSIYLPQAQAAVAQSSLQDYESVLVYEVQSTNALNATGTSQVATLSRDLVDVFHAIDAPARATRTPQTLSENRLLGAHVPCPNCPAPMTMKEAELFCKNQGKRLPTASEWELAARGTDGRLYPWGNRFEKTRANVIGLPDKGEEFGLKSIYDFPTGESPFGIIGAIGNAGQWIDSEGGYERTYIGGNYRFNPQDALVYSTMPETGDPMPQLEVTTRCVSSPRTPVSGQQN
jgi:hypothetical protein